MANDDRWEGSSPRAEPLYTGHEWAPKRHRVEYIDGGRASDAVIPTCTLCEAEMGSAKGDAPCTGERPPRPIFGAASGGGEETPR